LSPTEKPTLLSRTEREARVNQANEFIEVIASCGRRFFEHDGRIARFNLDDRGRLWFTDAYTQKEIYVAMPRYRWRGFSNGGTLRSLVENLSGYIRHGQPLWMGYFEPMRSGANAWGYNEEAMGRVRAAAMKLGDPALYPTEAIHAD